MTTGYIFVSGLRPEHLVIDDGQWIGVVPAGVEIDAEGKWLDKMQPTPSPELRELVMQTLGKRVL